MTASSDTLTRIAFALLGLVILFTLTAPLLSPWSADQIDWHAIEAPPTASHWFGTDLVGRDLWTRAALAGQTSLGVATTATTVSVVIGILWGAFAGLVGGKTDALMMRFVDILYGLPFILVVILLVVVFGRDPYLLFAGLGAVFWLDLARIVRARTLQIRGAAYIESARLCGASTLSIVRRHVLRNVAGPTLAWTTLTLPGVILAESFVSFLGLGVQEPSTSWGILIADGVQAIESAPWSLLVPAALLMTTAWSIGLVGDHLRDRLDPLYRNVTGGPALRHARATEPRPNQGNPT
ncbi:MAG: ABC transporter permease [Pseudomonadales bacterium]